MTTTLTTRRLKHPLSPNSPVIVELVRVWRDAREAHLRFLSDLHDAAEDRTYLSQVVLHANEFWIAEVGAAVAGFMAFDDEWVHHLYVAPPFQRRGVGSELLSIAMRSGRSLQLWAFEVNESAIRFYERRGFTVVERTNGHSNEAKKPDVRMRWAGTGIPSRV